RTVEVVAAHDEGRGHAEVTARLRRDVEAAELAVVDPRARDVVGVLEESEVGLEGGASAQVEVPAPPRRVVLEVVGAEAVAQRDEDSIVGGVHVAEVERATADQALADE